MLLAIDIGNTNVQTVVFNHSEITGHYISPSFDDIIKSITPGKITEAAISSVVPEKTETTIKKIKGAFGCDPFIVTRDARFNIDINYGSPQTLGIDRICSMEGAFQLNYNNFD